MWLKEAKMVTKDNENRDKAMVMMDGMGDRKI